MPKKIIINPITRISGFAEIEVDIDEGIIAGARTKGFLFRGFEKMLLGRSPFDAVYFTERICGICSTAHSMSSTLALEDALKIKPTEQGRYLRDFVHGCEFLQNHLRHFYQYTLPDFIELPDVSSIYSSNSDRRRLPERINAKIAKHYFDSLAFSRSAHEMLAVFGGKVPHNHGIFIGGITAIPTADKVIKAKSILTNIHRFIKDIMIPDVYNIAEYYPECFELGKGYGNFLTYGCFNDYKNLGTLYVSPKVYVNGKEKAFDRGGITENITYSWYNGGNQTYTPFERITSDDMQKKDAYSWVKAPRYYSQPCEVGPLARMWLSGDYRRGISLMDRTIARVLEAKKIAEIMKVLLQNVIPNISTQMEYELPEESMGAGLIDTTRGALGHWIKIDDKVISFYQIITPSVWNFSTKDEKGVIGVTEKALVGTPIQNTDNPIEIGRIVRSFDPCVSCATHIYRPGHEAKIMQVL